MKPGQLDRLLWRTGRAAPDHAGTVIVPTAVADVRVRDSGGDRPAIAFLCDPPVMVEACDELIRLLSPDFRVLVLELPGFGFSRPHHAGAYGFPASVVKIENCGHFAELEDPAAFVAAVRPFRERSLAQVES